MAFAQVQTCKASPTASGGVAITATYGSNVTAGNRLFIHMGHTVNGVTASPTPTKSSGGATISVFTKLYEGTEAGASTHHLSTWTAFVVVGGSLVLTATNTSTGGDELGYTASEYSGLDTSAGAGCLDKSAVSAAGNNNTTANIATGTTAATTAANQLALGQCSDWGVTPTGATWTLSTANGFTKDAGLSIDASTICSIGVATKTSASGATEGCTWTNGAVADLDMGCVGVIKIAAGGAANTSSAFFLLTSR